MSQEVIKNLVTLSKPIEKIREDLKSSDWDSDDEVLMTSSDVVKVLNRFISQEINVATIVEWANLIEGREDIDYQEPFFEEIKQLIYELANPDIEGEIKTETISRWIERLSLLS